MSAAQPKPSDNKAADAKQAAEPSMEEILASIRKIISDDQAPPPEPEPEPVAFSMPPEPEPAPAPEPTAEEDDVLDLASMMVPQPAPEPAPAPNLADDLDFLPESLAPPEPSPPPPPPPVAPPPPPPVFNAPPVSSEGLLSQGPNEAVTQAFGNLSHMIMSQNRTLDDLVKEMLRPMLRSWLDDNLPSLVERLVKAEIERVARGGR